MLPRKNSHLKAAGCSTGNKNKNKNKKWQGAPGKGPVWEETGTGFSLPSWRHLHWAGRLRGQVVPEGPELAQETPEPTAQPGPQPWAPPPPATASSRAAHHLLRHGRGDLIRELRRPGEHEETAQQAAEGRGEPERHGWPG